MIVKYKYQVDGTIQLEKDLMFEFKIRKYEFETDKQHILKSISISVKADADQYAPKITTSTSGPAKHKISINEGPSFYFIKEETRNLEGILSLFGMNEIDLAYPEISYIPETAEEKEKIKILSYHAGVSQYEFPSEPLTHEFLARAIVASYESFEYQIPFTFYRKAFVDYKKGWYLEACYDYYFLLEYLFAEGKFKSDEVKKNLQASQELQTAIKKILDDQSTIEAIKATSQQKYKKFLEGKTTEQISDFFVDLRGWIHHQSKKNKKGWHPANQKGFEFEAKLFTHVCFNLMMKTAIELMYGEDVDFKSIKSFQRVSP